MTAAQGRLGPIVGTSESAQRVRSYPWESSSLGPIDRWPSTLVAMVNLILNSSAAAAVYWGPELIFIGNDASTRMAGTAFKDSLGLTAPQIWGAHWPRVEDRFKAVLTGGHSFCNESLPGKFDPATGRDEVLQDYSLSPIFHDGSIAGIYRTLFEVTDEI